MENESKTSLKTLEKNIKFTINYFKRNEQTDTKTINELLKLLKHLQSIINSN